MEGEALIPELSHLEMMTAASFIMVLLIIETILIVSVLIALLRG
jgi:hypothetical protein